MCQLALGTWLPVYICIPRPQKQNSLFAKAGLPCRNSQNLPEPEYCRISLQISLYSKRRIGLGWPRWGPTYTLKEDTETIPRRCHHFGEPLGFLCPALSVLWLLFHFLRLMEVRHARKNMWCYSELEPNTWLWALPKLKILAEIDWVACSFLWHLINPLIWGNRYHSSVLKVIMNL